MSTPYSPPYNLTSAIVSLVAQIGEAVGRLSAHEATATSLRLRRINRIRTIQGSLAIEGNTLSETQITAILPDKPNSRLQKYRLTGKGQAMPSADVAQALRNRNGKPL